MQTSAPERIAAARALLAELKLDPAADVNVFERAGLDESEKLLSELLEHTQGTEATVEEWKETHRVLDALIELAEIRGKPTQAVIHANMQAVLYRSRDSDYSNALRASQRLVELQEKTNDPAIFLGYGNVGQNYASLGDHVNALIFYRKAREARPGARDYGTASLWRDIVRSELRLGNRKGAEAEVARFLELSAEDKTSFRALALLSRAELEIADNNYDAALTTIQQAQAADQSASATSTGYSILAALMQCVLRAMQELPYDSATKLLNRIRVEMGNEGMVPMASMAQFTLRYRQRLAGDIEPLLREETERLAAARASNNIDAQIDALRELGLLYSDLNAARNQVLVLEEARDLIRKRLPADGSLPEEGTLRLYLMTLRGLGTSYNNLHESDRARRSFDEVLKLMNAIQSAQLRNALDVMYIGALVGKARAYEIEDDPDGAQEYLQRALKAAEEAHRPTSDILSRLARVEYEVSSSSTRTADLYERSITAAQAERDLGSEVDIRLNYAEFLSGKGAKLDNAQAKAKEHLQAAEQQAIRLNYSDALWRARYAQGRLASAAGDPQRAIERYIEAVAKLEEMRAGLSQSEQRQSFVDAGAVQKVYETLIGALAAANRWDEAWDYLERNKARAFGESLQGRRFAQSQRVPEVKELAQLEGEIRDLRLKLSPESETVLRSAGTETGPMRAQLKVLEAKFALARQQSSLNSSRAGQALALTPLSLADVQKQTEAVLIEYALLPEALVAFVVTPDGRAHRMWPADMKQLRKQVLRMRTLLATPESGDELNQLRSEVSKVLFAPIAELIPPTTKRLVIVPSSYTNYLPFQVLFDDQGKTLADRYAISYLPSATTLAFLKKEKTKQPSFFLGALGNTRVEGMDPLPGTLSETAAIAEVFPKATRLAEGQFTHAQVKQALESHQWVHLATHGLVDDQAPLFSSLLVHPAEGQPSRLSLYEVMDMDLKADLVVLSACETGLGRLQGGDEVAGLTRTFLLAGANTVVSSLWKVSDEATSLLMQGFYRSLRQGKDPADAMREAELAVRERFPHPFYWAPFVVTGSR